MTLGILCLIGFYRILFVPRRCSIERGSIAWGGSEPQYHFNSSLSTIHPLSIVLVTTNVMCQLISGYGLVGHSSRSVTLARYCSNGYCSTHRVKVPNLYIRSD
jgi:hypothetical protein